MATIRDSLYVHGNIPCPTPTYSLPPSRQGSADHYVTKSVKHVSIKQPMNTEEELRNILRQAKQPMFHGPTQVAKRNDYFRKIKHLNDGMYGQSAPPSEPQFNLNYVDDFVLEGKKVDDNPDIPEEHKPQPLSFEFLDMDGRETMHSAAGMPIRSLRISGHSKSAKSFKSFYSSSSDPPPPRPHRSITLPQLTIGAARSKTRGEYIGGNEPFNVVVGNAAPKENIMEEYAIGDFRFPSPNPRRITYKGGDRTPRRDTTGNYGSMSLSELKACLHINRPEKRTAEHEEYIIQDYLTQFKQAKEHAKLISKSKKNSAPVNPFKLMNTQKGAKQPHLHPSPRYQFKTVESYLKFNKHQESHDRTNDVRTGTVHGQSAQAQAYSDTLLLKMMTDLNKPADHARRSANMAAVRLLNAGAETTELVVKNQLQTAAPCNSPVNRKPHRQPSAQPDKKPREIVQHIVFVPSGQTAKVRLLKG